MQDWHDGQLDLDPGVPLEASLKAAPAKWAVYLMSDADDRPVQLLCVRNLRASLKRRLGPNADEEPTKRVDYRQVVRRVRWKRVDNPLESDLAYLDVARAVYPATYRKLVTLRQAWWVHVDAEAPHPRWRVTDDPCPGCGQAFGPLAEKSHAQRLVERLEDLFDLCRYHNVLQQTPAGQPCAYKDMGKCPAPCDGTVSMQQYRVLVDWSRLTLADPQAEMEIQADRMRDAAGELRFELAGKIKQFHEGIRSLTTGEAKFVRPAAMFDFAAVQCGPGREQAKFLQVTLAGATEVLGLIGEPAAFPPLPEPAVTTNVDTERLGLIVSHLFSPKTGGVFLPRELWNRPELTKAYKAVIKQAREKPCAEESADEEGVVREAGMKPTKV